MCVNVLMLELLTVFHVLISMLLMLPNAWLLCVYLEINVLYWYINGYPTAINDTGFFWLVAYLVLPFVM
jgi:hypothetical protein